MNVIKNQDVIRIVLINWTKLTKANLHGTCTT